MYINKLIFINTQQHKFESLNAIISESVDMIKFLRDSTRLGRVPLFNQPRGRPSFRLSCYRVRRTPHCSSQTGLRRGCLVLLRSHLKLSCFSKRTRGEAIRSRSTSSAACFLEERFEPIQRDCLRLATEVQTKRMLLTLDGLIRALVCMVAAPAFR